MIAVILVICQSIEAFKGQNGDVNKKFLYGGVIVIILYIALFQYPNLRPLGMYKVTATVESESGKKYQAKVDISVEEVEKSRFDNEDGEQWYTVRVYKPDTIYWSNGGYTYLDPDATDYTAETGKTVVAYAYNNGERYKVTIPEIQFSPVDKILSIGLFDLLLYLISLGMGITAIVMVNVRPKSNEKEGRLK